MHEWQKTDENKKKTQYKHVKNIVVNPVIAVSCR